MTPEQAWQAIQDGQGYWPSDSAPAGPGEFLVESLDLSYMLTVDDGNGLILQPVIGASGMFRPADGSPASPATVYLQAAANA